MSHALTAAACCCTTSFVSCAAQWRWGRCRGVLQGQLHADRMLTCAVLRSSMPGCYPPAQPPSQQPPSCAAAPSPQPPPPSTPAAQPLPHLLPAVRVRVCCPPCWQRLAPHRVQHAGSRCLAGAEGGREQRTAESRGLPVCSHGSSIELGVASLFHRSTGRPAPHCGKHCSQSEPERPERTVSSWAVSEETCARAAAALAPSASSWLHQGRRTAVEPVSNQRALATRN